MSKKNVNLRWFIDEYKTILSDIDYFKKALELYGVNDDVSIELGTDLDNKVKGLFYECQNYDEYLSLSDIRILRGYNRELIERADLIEKKWGGLLK